MKKLYAFLIALLMLDALPSSIVQAQTYTINSYLVHKIDTPDPQGLGSGPNWKPITGTVDVSGELGSYAPYFEGELCGNGHQLPFPVRFGNTQLTTANTFTITCAGSVILSPTWDPSWIEEPIDGYNFTEVETTGANQSFYNSASPTINQQGEIDEGSVGVYANDILMPFTIGYSFNVISSESSNPTKFQYTVLGTAPNRELVVEVDNMHTFEDYAYGYNTSCSWQTVIYEAGISQFQFNYGPVVGNNPFGFDQAYEGCPVSYNGYVFPGSWGLGFGANEGSYALMEGYSSICGMKMGANQYIMIDWDGNGWNVNNPFVVEYNTPYGPGGPLMPDSAARLPQSSIRFQIAYPYDFAAGTITFPGNEQPEPLNTTFSPQAIIVNNGSSVPASLQVNFTMTEIGIGQVYNQTVTLTSAQLPGPFSQKSITLPPFTPGVSSPISRGAIGYGIYEDSMTVFNLLPTADQNPVDNISSNEWVCSPPNDIKAVAVINPLNGGRTQIGIATPITIRFRNTGTNNQTNVPLTATVHDASGNVVFRDTVIIPNWPSGPTGGNSDGTNDYSSSGQGPGKGPYYDTAFPSTASWIPSTLGTDTVFGIAIMSNDALRLDDTTKSASPILPEYDVASTGVVNPLPGVQEAFGTSWVPQALFQSVGVVDVFGVPIRAIISRCSDGVAVFQSDTAMEALNIDQNQVRAFFPTTGVGIYHSTSALPPGCYKICAIAHYNGDINSANDTACSQFSVIDRLKGDYYVGVGRQFQSIHQAVDTMRFRGIGANVRLILTDSSYTENGTYDISTPQGSIDMRGINGLSAASTVTWVPYPGQTPHIYFTGSQPFCFYMGDVFGGYMTFEGYNPSTVPTPDHITPEPAKRGITIIDNRTTGGSVFGIEEGTNHITLKDLVIHGNATFGSDSSAGVRIYNDHSLAAYASGVKDTIAINNIIINNCEIGNVKYGIYDHGYHDAFDPQKGTYNIWRNHNNVFTRNTIGTASNPIAYAGIQFNNETGIVISHNEISNVNAGVIKAGGGLSQNVYGILTPSITTYVGPQLNPVWPGDTGNVTLSWIDANRIRTLTALGGNTYGIAIQQSSYQYQSSGLTSVKDSLPLATQNRITNNMILDLRNGVGQVIPILMNTGASTYSSDRDSIYNNSITTNNAKTNIMVQYAKHAFLYNNVIQNTGSGPYTNYWLEVPRPYAQSINSDYNLFDLRGTNVFDSVIEYDVRYGTVFQRLYFRRLNDWRTYVNQDMHSLTGDPLFATSAMGTDSLHMPPALTYLESPASNNGIWLGSGTQARDFDGDLRLQGNSTPDIGADEWDGFQFTNDLAVMEIVQPAGFSQTSDTSLVTTESPLWINAVVKNLSSVGVYNQSVTAKLERSVGDVWTTVYTSTSAPLTWQVAESKNVVFQGPALTPANSTGVFRVTVSAPNDQNNANNTQQKAFTILLKQNAALVSYNGATADGKQNRDSVMVALNRLGVPFDTIDRNAPKGLPNTTIIDYTPWWTLIWVGGDPGIAPVAGQPTGQGGLTLQETDEITRYLGAGLTYAKKSMVIAGQNIAYYNGFVMSNNPVTDTAWMQTTMHTKYVANSPVSGTYNGLIVGQQPAYWTFADSLTRPTSTIGEGTTDLSGNLSPDVIKPALTTPLVGPIVNGWAYSYSTHPLTPNDSGAGVSYYNPTINTVFYGFDWANPYQTKPAGNGDTTSGTTRTLNAAFAFFRGHSGIILPIDNIAASGVRQGGNAVISWNVIGQKNVARYNVEQQIQNNWTVVGKPVTALDNESSYATTEYGIDPAQSYTYRVVGIDQTGAETYSNTVQLDPDPSELGFTLGASYPNPSAGLTNISFTLPEASQVTLRVMDVTGKVVNSDISNVSYAAGSQNVKLDLSSLPSGSYLYELVASGADGRSATLSGKLSIEKN